MDVGGMEDPDFVTWIT